MSNTSVSRMLARQARALESILKRVESQHEATSTALTKVREALDTASSDLSGVAPATTAKVKAEVSATAAPLKKKNPGAVEEKTPAQSRRERRAERAARAGKAEAPAAKPAKKKLAPVAAPSTKSSSLKKTSQSSGLKKAPVAAK